MFAANISAHEVMQDFIQAPPAPAAAAVPDDHWTCVTALRLQLAENDLDFSKARAQLAEKRMQRANFMVGKCLTRVAIADESLSAAKLALTEARQELDAAELQDDWEQDAVELNREQLIELRTKVDKERFERERAENAP